MSLECSLIIRWTCFICVTAPSQCLHISLREIHKKAQFLIEDPMDSVNMTIQEDVIIANAFSLTNSTSIYRRKYIQFYTCFYMAIFAPLLGLELVLIKVEYFVVDLTY